MSFVQTSIEKIDLVVKNKSIYVYKYKTINKSSTLLFCFPCILYSTCIRLVSCPFQCLTNKHTFCNPVTSCFIQSKISQQSDECVFNYLKECDKKIKIKNSYTIKDEEINEILKYASNKIQNTNEIKVKYAIAECVSDLIKNKTVDCTPDYIVKHY